MNVLEPFKRRVDRAGIHPNGPVVLIRNRDDGGEDRIHWWRTEHTSWSNRHNHRWFFKSQCLHGELEEEMIRIAGTHKEGYHTGNGFKNHIDGTWTDIGPVSWQVHETRIIKPGPARNLYMTEYHRVRALRETVTLVQTGRMARRWTIVLPDLPGENTNMGKFVVFDEVDIKDTIRHLENLLFV